MGPDGGAPNQGAVFAIRVRFSAKDWFPLFGSVFPQVRNFTHRVCFYLLGTPIQY